MATMSLDGTSMLRTARKRSESDLCAIFVHAGAGYHSHGNEHLHLKVCANACQAGMAFLKNGGSAVDAVEAAIKIMEDDEMTNAGYGSNLAMDGTVEGDATIVDHFGRSGAVGAVGGILNPIHVARLILHESTKPLTLRRVPPNLLCGQGAQDYAYCHNIPVLPKDSLVSPAARERWYRWSKDLQDVLNDRSSRSSTYDDTAPLENEGQDKTPLPAKEAVFPPPGASPARRSSATPFTPEDGIEFAEMIMSRDFFHPSIRSQSLDRTWDTFGAKEAFGGNITDTVGAIAVDSNGNIAAGSSSGGIGMKYKGRIGPAALVGIGSAVVPVNPADKEGTCTAAVCSGTGEHMATTMAAQTAASRVHYSKMAKANGNIYEATEDEALSNFVKVEFLKHPSVIRSASAGALGVMSVKRTIDGIHLYWAHNTESFAIGSMTSDDAEPLLVMSRSNQSTSPPHWNNNICTSGGRSMRCSTSIRSSGISAKRQKKIATGAATKIAVAQEAPMFAPAAIALEGGQFPGQ